VVYLFADIAHQQLAVVITARKAVIIVIVFPLWLVFSALLPVLIGQLQRLWLRLRLLLRLLR
jgi:hypothetical protein